MKVEKKATNKPGLIILLIVVLALVGGGGYYLITHKDSLNIDWNIKLPWSDKEEEEKKTTGGNQMNNKIINVKKNGDVEFKAPDGITTKAISGLNYCSGEITGFEDTAKEFIIKFKISAFIYTDGQKKESACNIDMYRYAADTFEVSGSTQIEVPAGKEKEGEITISKAELERQELAGINELLVYMKITQPYTKEVTNTVEKIVFSNNRSLKNEKSGILVDQLSTSKIEYYKTTSDSLNTYLYFIVTNQDDKTSVNIKIRKLIINDKVFDASEFEEEMGPTAKRIMFVAVPKKSVNKVKKFNISFMVFVKDEEGTISQYLISDEYSKEL